jgi:hypothetical protein
MSRTLLANGQPLLARTQRACMHRRTLHNHRPLLHQPKLALQQRPLVFVENTLDPVMRHAPTMGSNRTIMYTPGGTLGEGATTNCPTSKRWFDIAHTRTVRADAAISVSVGPCTEIAEYSPLDIRLGTPPADDAVRDETTYTYKVISSRTQSCAGLTPATPREKWL